MDGKTGTGPDEYVAAFERAADEAVEAGFWLAPEAEHFKAAARRITFGAIRNDRKGG